MGYATLIISFVLNGKYRILLLIIIHNLIRKLIKKTNIKSFDVSCYILFNLDL